MKRKCISIFLVCMMLFSIVSPAAFAADEDSAGELVISLSDATVNIDNSKEVKIDVSFDQNPGVYAVNFLLDFDETEMTYKGATDENESFQVVSNPDNNKVLIQGLRQKDYDTTGVITTLSFELTDNCKAGDQHTVALQEPDGAVAARYDKTTVMCSLEGVSATITVEGTAVHEHSLTKVEAKEATCTEAGNSEYYTCACGKLFADADATTEITSEDVTIAAKGHTGEVVAGKKATCTEAGLTEGKKCSVCGEVLVAQEVIPAAHSYGEWTVTKEPTATADGERQRTCSVCGYVDTDVIEATGGGSSSGGGSTSGGGSSSGSGSSSSSGSAVVTKPDTTIILTIDKLVSTVNGQEIISDVAPIIVDGRTYTPARFVAEQLGAKVDWNEETQLVTVTGKDGIVIELRIGSNVALVNGKPVQMDAAAFIQDSRTYTPARFVAEQLGAKVDWDDTTRQVTITKTK